MSLKSLKSAVLGLTACQNIGIDTAPTPLLKLEISLSFDKKYFARKSLSFRNIFAILISSPQKMLKNQRGSKN